MGRDFFPPFGGKNHSPPIGGSYVRRTIAPFGGVPNYVGQLHFVEFVSSRRAEFSPPFGGRKFSPVGRVLFFFYFSLPLGLGEKTHVSIIFYAILLFLIFSLLRKTTDRFSSRVSSVAELPKSCRVPLRGSLPKGDFSPMGKKFPPLRRRGIKIFFFPPSRGRFD